MGCHPWVIPAEEGCPHAWPCELDSPPQGHVFQWEMSYLQLPLMSGDFCASGTLSFFCLRGQALEMSKINLQFLEDLCEPWEIVITVILWC